MNQTDSLPVSGSSGERDPSVPVISPRSKHPFYQMWKAMKDRCTNPAFARYHRYGGRGITVCARWMNFDNFVADITAIMGPRPDGHSLDRIDNDGNYEPGNVRWATMLQQIENSTGRAKPKYITFRGETKHMGDWARAMGMKFNCLSNRLLRGWSVEEALTARVSPVGRDRRPENRNQTGAA